MDDPDRRRVAGRSPSGRRRPGGAADPGCGATGLRDVQRLVTEIRRFRADQGLPPARRVPAQIAAGATDATPAGRRCDAAAALTRLEVRAGDSQDRRRRFGCRCRLGRRDRATGHQRRRSTWQPRSPELSKDLAAAEKEIADTGTQARQRRRSSRRRPPRWSDKIRARAAKAEPTRSLRQRLDATRLADACAGPRDADDAGTQIPAASTADDPGDGFDDSDDSTLDQAGTRSRFDASVFDDGRGRPRRPRMTRTCPRRLGSATRAARSPPPPPISTTRAGGARRRSCRTRRR